MIHRLQRNLDSGPDGVVRICIHLELELLGSQHALRPCAIVLEWATAAFLATASLIVPARRRECLYASRGKHVCLEGLHAAIVLEGAHAALGAHPLLEVPTGRPVPLAARCPGVRGRGARARRGERGLRALELVGLLLRREGHEHRGRGRRQPGDAAGPAGRAPPGPGGGGGGGGAGGPGSGRGGHGHSLAQRQCFTAACGVGRGGGGYPRAAGACLGTGRGRGRGGGGD
mmetsp:Transcript_108158/g.336232  ORF Transcript_108158/g.336232 Transcript_108158/m.336232 type:complete len:230 (+) Transcript_108158:1149-1838(+)